MHARFCVERGVARREGCQACASPWAILLQSLDVFQSSCLAEMKCLCYGNQRVFVKSGVSERRVPQVVRGPAVWWVVAAIRGLSKKHEERLCLDVGVPVECGLAPRMCGR